MHLSRLAPVATAFATVLGAVSIAAPAFAVAPANDTYDGRVSVDSVPFHTTLDTTEATTDAVDDELNAVCGAPATDASVWYEFTAAADGGLVADVSASDYSAGVFVAVGSPGSFEVLACAPGAIGWTATAGETYTLMVIDDQDDGAGNGGLMDLTIAEAPPAPEIDITVNPKGQFTRTGTAIISGQVTCTGDAEFAFIEAELTQRVGRLLIRGFNGTEITCDGTTRPWSLEIAGDNGLFAGGRAASVTFAVACGVFDCGTDFEERVVQLSGKKQ